MTFLYKGMYLNTYTELRNSIVDGTPAYVVKGGKKVRRINTKPKTSDLCQNKEQ